MRTTSILLALTGLGAASSSLSGQSLPRGSQKNLLKPGKNTKPNPVLLSNNALVNLASADGCYSFEGTCDSNYCIPLTGTCCGLGDGSYCALGKYCTSGGCCPLGQTCTGSASGCDDGLELCGDDHCIPEGSVCCSDSGSYCDAGETCTSDGFCSKGSSGDDGSSDDDGDDDGQCYSFQEVCDDGCMPEGSVCCGDGYYCFAGDACADEVGKCIPGGGDSDSSTTATLTQSTKTSFTLTATSTRSSTTDTESSTASVASEDASTTSYSLSPLPTSIGGGSSDDDDDDGSSSGDDASSSSADSSGASASSTADSGDNQPDAASMTLPSILVGLVALLPLAL